MHEVLIAIVTVFCLLSAAIGGLLCSAKLRSRHLQDDTNATVRLVANIFVVMTTLVLSLMMNSARNTLELNERNVHALATDLILLDRLMRSLGPQAEQAHQHLVEYVQTSLTDSNIAEKDPQAESFLGAVGESLREIRPSNDQQTALWNDARQLYQQAVQQRWVVVDASSGTIPAPLIILVIAWLVMIFARSDTGHHECGRDRGFRGSRSADVRDFVFDPGHGCTENRADPGVEPTFSARAGRTPAMKS